MTNEEYQLLSKDLCARLPYGVVMTNKVSPGIHYVLSGRDLDDANMDGYLYDIPYLRPVSSMTEEEEHELSEIFFKRNTDYQGAIDVTDFFYSHHIDCRGLIEKGLALEAPEEMYGCAALPKIGGINL